ncbi:MAG: O-antigen ligase family protein [Bacteroidales bacterium]
MPIHISFKGLYFAFLILMVLSLPFSTFGLSVAQFGLLGTWIIEGILHGNPRKTITKLLSSKPALVLVSFFLLHLLGLLYTTDWGYALKDIRIKLPLLLLPVIFVTSQKLRNHNIDLLLSIYITSILTATFISLGILLTKEVNDFRELSPFISHIRLSLNVCLAFFFALHLAFQKYRQAKILQVLLIGMAVWFMAFLVMIESLTGLIILFSAGFLLTFYGIFHFGSKLLRLGSIAVLFLVPVGIGFYLYSSAYSFLTPDKHHIENHDLFTSQGNPYLHDTNSSLVEHGRYIGVYICEEELREEWKKRSAYDYDGLDEKKQKLRFTLFRYLNSKGLRKDADGLRQLGHKDIRNVELGIANIYYTRKFSVNSRLHKIFWEYQIIRENINPGGHSLIQRLEYWKAALDIIRNHVLFGVGTGDIKQAFADHYEATNSPLEMQFRHRAHNQYLATTVTFGILGLFLFLFSLFYPGIWLKKIFTYRYFVFLITLLISMLVEDTLETQMGVTLFAFFNTMLLFGPHEIEKTG